MSRSDSLLGEGELVQANDVVFELSSDSDMTLAHLTVLPSRCFFGPWRSVQVDWLAFSESFAHISPPTLDQKFDLANATQTLVPMDPVLEPWSELALFTTTC